MTHLALRLGAETFRVRLLPTPLAWLSLLAHGWRPWRRSRAPWLDVETVAARIDAMRARLEATR